MVRFGVILGAAAILIAGVASARADTMTVPLSVETSSGGGAAWSFLHTATSNLRQPSGAEYGQYTSGAVVAAIGDGSGLFTAALDMGISGAHDQIDAGDTVFVAGSRDLMSFTGSVTNPTIGSKIGAIDLSGELQFVEGGSGQSASASDWGTDGSLAFTIAFTADHGAYTMGDEISGSFYFQSAAWAGPFNGANLVEDAGSLLFDLALWGDNRPDGSGAIAGTWTNPGGDLIDGSYALGLDLKVGGGGILTTTVVPNFPEPGATLLVAVGLLSICIGRRRRLG